LTGRTKRKDLHFHGTFEPLRNLKVGESSNEMSEVGAKDRRLERKKTQQSTRENSVNRKPGPTPCEILGMRCTFLQPGEYRSLQITCSREDH
jgi:hypothetical protein